MRNDDRGIGSAGGHPFDLVFHVREPGRDWSAAATGPGARSLHAEAAIAAKPRGFTLVSAGTDQRLQARSLEAGRWSAAAVVPEEPGRRAADPALLVGPAGRLLLTWRSFGDEGGSRARVAMPEGGAGFTDLFASPPLRADDPRQGGPFNARGMPVAWSSGPGPAPSSAGGVWTKSTGTQ